MLVSLVAASCTNDSVFTDNQTDNMVDISIDARILGNPEPDTASTRTYMGTLNTTPDPDIYPVLWSEGDAIGLISGGAPVRVALSTGAGTSNATFGGRATDIVAPFPGTNLYPAAYPAEKSFAQIESDKVLVGSYLPYIQTYKAGSFSDNVYPMASVSQSQGAQYDFYNLCGVIQLRIRANTQGDAKNTIRALYLTGNNHEALAGGVGMYFNVSDGTPVVSEELKDGPDSTVRKNMRYEVDTYGSEAYERIIIDFGATPLQLSTEEDTYINIAVIPQTFTNGFTVEMIDGGNLGSTYKTIDTPITIQRSCVKQMVQFTYTESKPLEVANSYVYSEAGYYLMPGYCMGNRLDVKLDAANAHPNKAADLLWSDLVTSGAGHTDDRSKLLPAVTNIEYVSFADGNGMLQFKINTDPNTGKPYRGNASIALYDADTKEILWSWHVWMCETVHDVIIPGRCDGGEYICEYPDGSTYHYQAEAATDGKIIVMDRNLGAISATPADGWKTYGLYYQNGRRDPFIGGRYNGSNDMTHTTTITPVADETYMSSVRYDDDVAFGDHTAAYWYNEDLAPKGWNLHESYITVSRSLQAPMDYSCGIFDGSVTQAETFTTKAGGGGYTAQWTKYTEDDNKSWLDPTVDASGTHGNTGLRDAGHEAYWNRTKTIMDPCPVGYSVLGSGEGTGGGHIATRAGGDDKSHFFNGSGYTFKTSNTDGYGLLVTYTTTVGTESKTFNSWWPAAGVRTYDGRMANVGYSGAYFYYDHIEASHGGHGAYFELGSTPAMKSTNNTITNHAGPLRCVREKQFGDLSTYPLK